VKELIARLQKQYDGLTARMESALTAASAEGATAEAVTAANADFDAAEAERKKVKLGLDRAKQIERENTEAAAQAAAAAAVADATPARQPIVQPVHNPAPAIVTGDGVFRLPAGVRRHGPLKAFKGPNANERAYKFGLWVAATMYNHGPSLKELEKYGLSATLSTVDNNKAGYFVPDQLTTDVIELQELYGVIRRLADVEPMASEIWKGPRWTNNMTAYWVSQGNAPAQSEPGWDQIELKAKDLAAFGKMTVQLNADALIDLGDKWAMAAAVAFSYAEDNAAFNGDGTSAYGGIVGLLTKIVDAANSASLFTATGHTTLGDLTIADFSAVVGKFPSYPAADPCWLCHKEVYANSMLPLMMNAGGATPLDIQNGGKPRFMGYDVEFVAVMPKAASVTTGVTGILFADLDLSTKFGDRRQRVMRVGEINDDMIKQLITLFAASRVDIVNHTIVDPKTSTSPGPVIGLKLG
jgi:HK97 family phage major capsid protein